MSRRKQPNPKSLKDAIEKLVEKKLLDFTNEPAIQANLTQCRIDETLKPHSDTGTFEEVKLKTYVEVNDQNLIKHKEEAEFDDDENEIDVENISDKEECCKDEQRRSVLYSSIFLPPIGPVKFESSSKSIPNYQGYEKKTKQEENEVCRTEAIQSIETSKLAHRQRFSVNLQKQNTQSVIINGKRYYPLKFKCEDCDLRYSDQSTLDTHKQNYCSKRNQTPSTLAQAQSADGLILTDDTSLKSSASSSTSSTTSSSESSRSNSPTSNTCKFKTLQIPNEQFEQRLNISNVDNVNILNQAQQNFSDINANANNSSIVKSVVYQCNYCPFQTDKKCTMNKHSRVHLPQKRRAMEEATFCSSSSSSSSSSTSSSSSSSSSVSNSSVSEKNDQEVASSLTSNDKQNSYCTECDIQFSSIKTFMHHRNNYCQKYKTIESFIPMNSIAATKKLGSDSIEQKQRGMVVGIDTIKNDKCDENKQSPHDPQLTFKQECVNNFSNPQVTPTNAVRMGDTVYVPLYKLPVDESNLKQPIQTVETFEKNDSIKSLDLTLKNKIFQTDRPLNLSIKNPIIGDLNSDQTASADLEKMYALSKLAYPLPFSILKNFYSLNSNPNASILSNMSNLDNQLKFELLKQSLNMKNYNFLLSNMAEYELYLSMISSVHQNSLSNNVEEAKLYPLQCPKCRQIFIKHGEFRHHNCMLLMNSLQENGLKKGDEKEEETQKNERKYANLKRHIQNEISDEDHDDEIEEQNCKPMRTTNKGNMGCHFRFDPSLLKHETVRTTLVETYGCKSLSELLKLSQNEFGISNQKSNHVKNFYICTSCGYRGNTQRGVKQHGKLHMSNGEHFAVIFASNSQPILVYNSEDDSELTLKLNRHNQSQLTFKLAKGEEDVKIKLNEEQVERNECRTNETCDFSAEQSTDRPISKKARLLNFKQEEVNPVNLVHTPNQLVQSSDKSQTYCHKCDIQFQRMNNYLAHKKSYCKDD